MLDRVKRIIRKYYEFLVTKLKILKEQRIFCFGGVKVKYMLKQCNNSDTLVIVFSACTRRGLKARYNYVKTLDGMPCSRLFILDDYAKDHRGSYYLGHNFQFDEEKATNALIQWAIKELAPQKLIFCGSSKGGYAALNFGVEYADSYMIIGAPQYFLTSYLEKSGNVEALDHILGIRDKEKDTALEYRLRNKIIANTNKERQHFFIHFSNKEHTYEEHIIYLLKDMEEFGYHVETDVASYTNHSDLSYYFPDFLKKHISEIVYDTNA